MSPDDLPAVTFTRMTDATAEEYSIILRHSVGFLQGLPDRFCVTSRSSAATRADTRSIG